MRNLTGTGKYLIQSFGKAFYQQYAAGLIASYILLFGYGIFIKTAGHIPSGQEHTIYLVLLLNFVQSPIIATIVLVLWLIYTINTWFFIVKKSKTQEYLFWYYSITALPLRLQIIAWWWLQVYLSLPFIVYWTLALTYGLIIGKLTLALLTGLYLLLLTILSSIIYVYRFNFLVFKQLKKFRITEIVKRLPKPFFCIFLFELLTNQSLALLVTKGISFAFIIGAFSFFEEIDEPLRFLSILGISIALTHALILFLIHRFCEKQLYFIQQLPIERWKIYIYEISGFFLLLLPEFCLLGSCFSFTLLPITILISLGGVSLLRSFFYVTKASVLPFLKWSFSWFCLAILLTLFDATLALGLLNLGGAFIIFYIRYYRREMLI